MTIELITVTLLYRFYFDETIKFIFSHLLHERFPLLNSRSNNIISHRMTIITIVINGNINDISCNLKLSRK